MRITLENTTKVVELVIDGQRVPARVWEGETASGIKIHAYITRIAVSNLDDASEFEMVLQSCRAPSPEVEAIPLRLIL